MSPKTILNRYLKKLTEVVSTGDAREESFYPALKDLLQEFSQTTERSDIHVTVLPRPTEAGNPDFRIWDGIGHIVGYMEAKSPSTDLNKVAFSEQLQRYLATFPNLILTNFLEFWLFRDGLRIATARLARPVILTELQTRPPIENADEVWALLEHFFQFSLPGPFTAEELAVELAKRTRFLRDIVLQQLTMEQGEDVGPLVGFYEAFQKFLIGSLEPRDFADLYAQTVTYGLFAARTRATNGFTRRGAFDHIPHSIGILRELFRFISLGELPEEMEWIVDDIAEVLAAAEVSKMLVQYYREGKGGDPIVHFYETFLAYYDPEERERRGVYYTPEPVVSYIVHSLHALLKEKFGMADGLASKEVTLLDPAAGTMTFVARAAETATHEFTGKYGAGGRKEFLRTHILRNYYAFELMMAPYAVGHLKMAFFLEELGHRLDEDERIPFPDDRDVFVSLAELGQRLVDLHLLRSPELNLPLARFEGKGDCRIAKTKRDGFGYDPQTERVYINPNQYFTPVPVQVWEHPIGGYQVCEKWLKDRRKRILGLDEIRNYCRIVTALARTIEIQEEIDALYSRVEERLLMLEIQ